MLPFKLVLTYLIALIVVALGMRSFVQVQQKQAYPPPPPTVSLQRSVCYVRHGGQDLTMDIATPKTGGPFPAVVCIHGGGWKSGSKKEMLPCMYDLAQQGCVAVSIDYRLAPRNHFLDQIDDCKAAVRYIRSHAAELNVNPARIGAVGSSAGGHLALMLGTTGTKEFPISGDDIKVSSAVKVVVSLAGPTDLTKEMPGESEATVEKFIGRSRQQNPEMFEKASPVHYLNRGDAPILMIHGTQDQQVPYSQATELLAACRKIGVECELLAIRNGGHGFGGSLADWNGSMLKMEKFLIRHLMSVSLEL